MKFLIKLFKALNSAQTPWQVTLAIALGMVAGLTPMSGIQTVVILFLAFLLNIHLGLFFVASAFFAGIGYLFDPWFEQAGYALLASESLKGVWTAWYNSGLMRLTHFNNTLVMGSTAVALLLAVPLYLLLGWAIKHYREALSVFLERYPKLGLFGILKVSQNKDPLLRWWGAGLFAGAAAVTVLIAVVVVDPVVKWVLEKGGSAALQRDVRIGGVDVDFMEGSVTIDRIEIAGEQEGIDALSAERAAFDIALGALLMHRTHIEHAALNGIGFDTPATLKKAAAPAAGKGAPGSAVELPGFELPTPASLLANADLQTVKAYHQADKEIGEMVAKWQKVAEGETFSAAKLAELKKDFEALKKKSGTRDPQQLIELKDEIGAFNKKVTAYKEQLSATQDEFNADRKRIGELYELMEQASAEDYRRLRSAYDFSGGGTMNIVSILFGDRVKKYLSSARRYYAMAEPYLQSEPEPPVPPRGAGRWMHYPLTGPTPDLWIAKTEIDGMLNAQTFNAVVNDVSDNQKKLGRALTFLLESDGPRISGLSVSGEDNRQGAKVADRVSFVSKGMTLDALALDPLAFGQSRMAFKGEVTLDDMNTLGGKSSVTFSDTAISMKGEGKAMQLAAGVLESVHAFSADVKLGGTLLLPQVTVSTDLDARLAKAMAASFSKEAAAYSKELKGMLSGQSSERLAALKERAGGLADINALAGERTKALTGLSGDAASLLKPGGDALKGLLPF